MSDVVLNTRMRIMVDAEMTFVTNLENHAETTSKAISTSALWTAALPNLPDDLDTMSQNIIYKNIQIFALLSFTDQEGIPQFPLMETEQKVRYIVKTYTKSPFGPPEFSCHFFFFCITSCIRIFFVELHFLANIIPTKSAGRIFFYFTLFNVWITSCI